MTAETRRPIALGVLLDGRVQERWTLECVRQAEAVPGVKLAAVALVSLQRATSAGARLHRLFDRIDQRVRCLGERLFAPIDVASELALPPLHLTAVRRDDHWQPDEAGTAALRCCEVDVWLCFAAARPLRLPRSAARFGIWGIEIGEGVPATHAWAGAAELSAASPVTMVSVVDYAEPGAGVRYRSFGVTAANSPRRNRLRAVRKGLSFLRRLLERLALGSDTGPPATLPAPAQYPGLPAPTVPALARLSWRLASNWVGHRLPSRERLEQWQIAYCFTDDDALGCRFERLRYLVPPADRFWADPFAVEHQGRHFIFFEELPYRTSKGRLAAVEVFEQADPGEAQVVLERPYHLSYPFVFCWEGGWYMIPETAQNRTVELYRCDEFPRRWHLDRVLLDHINAVDATLWRQGGRWWMFVNVAEPDDADTAEELHLYCSETPFGPWSAHPRSPVVSDVRCARPAGPLFSSGGKLYRPSQDCSLVYGHSVVINRVEGLGEDGYRETAVERIMPGWSEDALRVHHVSGTGRLRVIDCLMRR